MNDVTLNVSARNASRKGGSTRDAEATNNLMKPPKNQTFNKTIRPAASVILVRDGVDGPEVFMLQRPGRGDFPELHVFPGGKVDEEDDALGPQLRPPMSPNHPPARFKIAAIRECFEESGVLLVDSSFQYLSLEDQDMFRAELLESEVSFAQRVEEFGLTIDDHGVEYFSHWITPPYAPARFDTRFFIAEISAHQNAENHASETVAGLWQTPEHALALYAKGEWQMIVPTLTTLRMISGYPDVATLMDTVRRGLHRIPVTQRLHESGMQYFVGPWCTN